MKMLNLSPVQLGEVGMQDRLCGRFRSELSFELCNLLLQLLRFRERTSRAQAIGDRLNETIQPLALSFQLTLDSFLIGGS